MSFCSLIKDELIAIRLSGCCKPSYIYGFMLFGRSFSINKIALQTGNENVAKAYAEVIRRTYKADVEITCGGSSRPTYIAKVSSAADRLKILAMIDFGISETVIDRSLFLKECCIQSFVRAAFFLAETLATPKKNTAQNFRLKTKVLQRIY